MNIPQLFNAFLISPFLLNKHSPCSTLSSTHYYFPSMYNLSVHTTSPKHISPVRTFYYSSLFFPHNHLLHEDVTALLCPYILSCLTLISPLRSWARLGDAGNSKVQIMLRFTLISDTKGTSRPFLSAHSVTVVAIASLICWVPYSYHAESVEMGNA